MKQSARAASAKRFYDRCKNNGVSAGAICQSIGDLDGGIQAWLIDQCRMHEITLSDFARALIVDAYDEDQEAKQ